MYDRPESEFEKLIAANRILVEQRVLDVFGHVSFRDKRHRDVFWLSTALPPNRVKATDLVPFDLSGAPLEQVDAPLFSERFIHASILRARPDVNAVCHHHSPSIMPFCLAQVPLRAVSQTGAFMGHMVNLWDSADAFGATRILVDTIEQADSLVGKLGDGWIVLMRGHGATVAGRSIEDVTFKSVFSCRDADALHAAMQLGSPMQLSEEEIAMIGQPGAAVLERSWRYWTASNDLSSQNAPSTISP